MTIPPSPPIQSSDLSIKAAASLTPCCVRTLRKAIARGHLRAYRIGHRIVIKLTYLQAREVPVIPDERVKQSTCLHSEKAAHHPQAPLGKAEQGESDE